MNRRDYEQAIEREVAEWPGVTVTFEEAGKHPRAVMTFGEASRFTPFPGTPSDSARGLDVKISEVRRMLREMGAVRNERPKSTRPPSERNPGADLRELPAGEPAPVVANPWERLDTLPPLPSTVRYYTEVVQGSDEWAKLRLGLLTASEMRHIVTPATLKAAANEKAKAHLWELLAQRITKYVEPTFYGDEMLRGHEDEIEARRLYSKHISPVEDCGFITNDRWGFTLGYSPDGLIEERTAGIEAKSRRQKFQVQAIVEHHLIGAIPTDFLMQCHTGIMVAELSRLDLISYSGGLPMIPMKVWPDDKIQDAIIEVAGSFEKKLAEAMDAYFAALETNANLIPTERRIEQEMYI